MEATVRSQARSKAAAIKYAFPTWLLVAVTFAALYDFRVPGFPELARSTNLALIALIGMAVASRRLNFRYVKWPLLLVCGGFLPYAAVLTFSSGDPGALSRMAYLALYGLIAGALVGSVSRDKRQFLMAWLVAVSLQGMILAATFQLDFARDLVSSATAVSTYYDQVGSGNRGIGITANAGSALSLLQATGVLAGLLLMRSKDYASRLIDVTGGGGRFANWRALAVPTLTALCAITTVFAGRTGIVVAVVLILLVPPPMSAKALAMLALGTLAFAWLAVVGNADAASPVYSAEQRAEWLSGTYRPWDVVAYIWTQQPVPALSSDTFIGTGLVSLDSFGQNPSGNDSGLIQTYFAYGIIVAALIYSAYTFLVWRAMKSSGVRLALLAALVFLLIEMKEPFLFKYSVAMFLAALYTATKLEEAQDHRDDGALKSQLTRRSGALAVLSDDGLARKE